MAAFLDLCRFVASAGGTTDWTYSSTVSPYISPTAAGAVNSRVYKVRAESADLTQWEVSEGAYNSAGAGSFARTTVLYNSAGTGTLQSGAGTKINFTLAPQVWVVASKRDLLSIEEANSFTTAQKSQAKANLKISGPTVTVLTSGTAATYNTPTGCTRIRVRGIGGGGGMGATSGGQTAGGMTSFAGTGITTMTATGGGAGTGQGGGAAAGGVGSNGQINYTGGVGVGCFTMTGFVPGQIGGTTFLHPGPEPGGQAQSANTGHGAADAAKNFVSNNSNFGAGGGGGGFERWIDVPAASYTYTIGAGGSAGTSGWAGGSGVIVIEEFYD